MWSHAHRTSGGREVKVYPACVRGTLVTKEAYARFGGHVMTVDAVLDLAGWATEQRALLEWANFGGRLSPAPAAVTVDGYDNDVARPCDWPGCGKQATRYTRDGAFCYDHAATVAD